MSSTVSLDRFKLAQADPETGFATAISELRAGRKTSHWIWYIFPQLAGLGRSSTARHYGLRDRVEAADYLRDAELAPRLHVATAVVAEHLAAGMMLVDLMGGTTDALKLVSCLTLFEQVGCALPDQSAVPASFLADCAEILRTAESQGFPHCDVTRRF